MLLSSCYGYVTAVTCDPLSLNPSKARKTPYLGDHEGSMSASLF